jgi:glyoxalase family protein
MMYPPQRIVAGFRDEAAIAALNHDEPVDEITDEMKLSGIHHISAISPGLTEVGEFYEETLGLKLVKKTINRDSPDVPHWFWANYHDGIVEKASAFTIFGAPPTWSNARAGVGQTRGVAFRTPDADSQLAWRDHLLSRGLEVSPVVDHGPFQSIYFNAPDGLQLQIATDIPGF